MLPTLREGDLLLVRHGARVGVGDLVVARFPDGTLAVKRAAEERRTRTGEAGWWVERDNRREGVDSWSVGAIPDEDVVALVLGRLWPRPRPM